MKIELTEPPITTNAPGLFAEGVNATAVFEDPFSLIEQVAETLMSRCLAVIPFKSI